jgi:hypothetical protein
MIWRRHCSLLVLSAAMSFLGGCSSDSSDTPDPAAAGGAGGSAGQGGAGSGGATAGSGGATAGSGGKAAGSGGATAGSGGNAAGSGGNAAGSGGTGGAGGGVADNPDCDPLVPTQCGYPFPSDRYLVDDAKMPSGKRVAFGATTLPVYLGGSHVDPKNWSDSDGFSPGQAPLTHLPGATVTGLPTQDTIADSLKPGCPTVLINAETGELVPHFAELDVSSADESDQAFLIRPVVRLKDKTRYIAAIRGVVDKAGAPLAPSPAFQALRDKTPDASIEARRDHYEALFASLDKAGVARKDLQIAWDYTTASTENNTRNLLHMRDEALALVGDTGPAFVIDKVDENPNGDIRRVIHGRMTVPLYLDKPGVGGVMVYDDKGLPKQNGTAEYTFLVQIPNSAAKAPAAILQQGHGLLGAKEDSLTDWEPAFFNKYNYAMIAVDWIGLAEEDKPFVTQQLVGDLGGLRSMFDRQQQGVLNALLAMRMMKGGFWKDPAAQIDGKQAIDPTQSYYQGDSQGGILGTTYMALSTDVTRGELGEAGMPYNLLLNRSADFTEFFQLFKVSYGTNLNLQLALGLLQMNWDRAEPDGFAPFLTSNTLPGTPAHRVLMHVSIGDFQVTPLGAHIIARTVGARNLKPVNRSIWGVDDVDGPLTEGSAMVEYNFSLPEAPKTDIPPTQGDDTHDRTRALASSQKQLDTFFRQGIIEATCDGPCDPE